MADLYFTEEGDLTTTPSGDLAMTDSTLRDDVQQAYIRVLTDQGDYLIYPDLGADLSSLIGEPQSPRTGKKGEELISSALKREGYFDGKPFTVKAVPTGPQCQPVGSMVRIPKEIDNGKPGKNPIGWEEVPIESLNVGDHVVTVKNKRGLVKRGRPITAMNIYNYEGEIITVEAADKVSAYAPHHKCIAVLGHDLEEGNHIVYMMMRDGNYRIGRTVWKNTNVSGNSHGMMYRTKREKADAFWVLSVHQTESEAALHERMAQIQYGIPGESFEYKDHYKMDLDIFWNKMGNNYSKADKCLSSFGLMIDYPLWERNTATRTGSWSTKVTTAAVNLRNGMLTFVPSEDGVRTKGWRNKGGGGVPWSSWKPIAVSRSFYSGDIVSLAVAEEQNYIADGILTHNSIRFDVSIVSRNREQVDISIEQDL